MSDQVPPEVELKPPPPPDCGELAGCWNPFWLLDELLLDPLESLDEPDEPVPELELELELELDDELPPVVVVAAWLVPGRMAAMAPATATLAKETVMVVAFSRRRPCSRSATARATWRALLARPAGCSSQLFTSISIPLLAVNAVGEVSADVLSARHRPSPLRRDTSSPQRGSKYPASWPPGRGAAGARGFAGSGPAASI